MILSATLETNLKVGEVKGNLEKALALALKDVTTDITRDVIQGSPVDTGNNRRSIAFEIKPTEASIYSTSGYGGFLETGTRKMAARPYFKPALDRNFTQEKFAQLVRGHLGA